jgi:hypothetical protein
VPSILHAKFRSRAVTSEHRLNADHTISMLALPTLISRFLSHAVSLGPTLNPFFFNLLHFPTLYPISTATLRKGLTRTVWEPSKQENVTCPSGSAGTMTGYRQGQHSQPQAHLGAVLPSLPLKPLTMAKTGRNM